MPYKASAHGRTIAIAMCASLIASSLQAAHATPAGDRQAYELAKKCFVANVYESGNRRDAGDAAEAEDYKAKGRRAFDLAYKLGEKIGLSDKQIGRDLDFAQNTELPHMIQSRDYFVSTVATCKAVGLM